MNYMRAPHKKYGTEIKMLSITLLCVGTLREAFFKEACAEYEKRLSRFCRLETAELPAYALCARPSEKEILRAVDDEGRRILQKIPPAARVFALCPDGREFSSEEFARLLPETARTSSRLVFAVGGPNGLSSAVRQAADGVVSMSRMTFPHTLARVMLLEQIYRGFKIGAGETYHK